jgi:hypothetical protein
MPGDVAENDAAVGCANGAAGTCAAGDAAPEQPFEREGMPRMTSRRAPSAAKHDTVEPQKIEDKKT